MAHDRAVTLTLTHNINLILLFVTSRKLSLNSFFRKDINVRILKQRKLVNVLLVSWKNHKLNRFFKLINKILLFQYSKGIFSVHTRALTLKLAHKLQLIKLLLKN